MKQETAPEWQKPYRMKLKYLPLRRMEAAWLALANEQDWLDAHHRLSVMKVNRGGYVGPLI